MIVLTKAFKFSAAHRYNNPRMSPEENLAVFGDDHRIHGHNYVLEVSLTGEVDPDTGFLVDLEGVKKLVQRRVIDILDHAQIEADIPWFADRQPTSENLVIFIWDQVAAQFPAGVQLVRVRLYETPSIFSEYDGSLSSAIPTTRT